MPCALGVFALIVCIEKPAHAGNQPWCIYKNLRRRLCRLPLRDFATMLGGSARNRRFPWTQSPVFARTTSQVTTAILRGLRPEWKSSIPMVLTFWFAAVCRAELAKRNPAFHFLTEWRVTPELVIGPATSGRTRWANPRYAPLNNPRGPDRARATARLGRTRCGRARRAQRQDR